MSRVINSQGYQGLGAAAGCPAAPVCPNGYTATVVEQDLTAPVNGVIGSCPGYDCLNAQHQPYSSTLPACNQNLLYVQPSNLAIEAAALLCLLLLPGFAKLLAVVPAGLFVLSNLSTRMDHSADGTCVAMSSGL
jgi:hypothetical protein